MKIEIDKHKLTGEVMAVISDDRGLVATIIPRKNELVVVSKYVSKDSTFTFDSRPPAKITIKLNKK